jgi:hypothetical protein
MKLLSVFTVALILLFGLASKTVLCSETDESPIESVMLQKAFGSRRGIYGGFGHGLASGGWYGTGVGGHGRVGGDGAYGGLGYNPWPFGGYSTLFG